MSKQEPSTFKTTAIISEGVFLLNLLLPVIPYIGLLFLYLRHRSSSSKFLWAHTVQPVVAASISTLLFLAGNLFVILSSGYKSIQALIIFEIYYIAVVPPFLVLGLFGLIKAMSDDIYIYPVIGRFVDL